MYFVMGYLHVPTDSIIDQTALWSQILNIQSPHLYFTICNTTGFWPMHDQINLLKTDKMFAQLVSYFVKMLGKVAKKLSRLVEFRH